MYRTAEPMEIRKLNTLRGLAALIVLISHYSNESGLWGGYLGNGAGQFGVMIFFLLSSFLMAYLYLQLPPTIIAIKKYSVARIARVFPLFVVVVISSFVMQRAKPNVFSEFVYNINSFQSLFSHLLLLSGLNVLWTIPPEINFYILFAVAWCLRPRFGKTILYVSAIALSLYAVGVWPGRISGNILGLEVDFATTMALPYFIVGSLFGSVFRYWRPPTWLCSHWFVVPLLLIPLLYPRIFLQLFGKTHEMWSEPLILACISAIFFVVVFLVPSPNLFLENMIGDKIGAISYSLYLLHYPLLLCMKKLGYVSGFSGLVLFLFFSIALSFLSFLFLEAPMRRKIKGFHLFSKSYKICQNNESTIPPESTR